MEEIGNGKKLEHRLTTLEKDVEYIKRQVDNHIPTALAELQKSVDGMSTRLWGFIVSFALALLALLLTIIFK
jgi:hypothetical protein